LSHYLLFCKVVTYTHIQQTDGRTARNYIPGLAYWRAAGIMSRGDNPRLRFDDENA